MSLFAVDNEQGLLDAVNYAISNLGTGEPTGDVLVADPATGRITRANAPNNVVSYLYQFINVRYADSADGTVNFSTSPTNRLYYGVRNSSSSAGSSNPADYIWTQVSTPGFSTNRFLYFSTYGGRQISFVVQTAAPAGGYAQVQDNTPIDLDVIISTTAQQIVQVNIYQRAPAAPATPTGGTYDFNTLALTPPTGWYSSVPAGTDPIWVSTNTFEASPSTSSVAPTRAWSTPSLLAESATSTFTVVAYADNTSVPATPTGGTWNFSTGTGTPPTGNVTWTLTPFTPTGNLYTSQSIASILGSSGTANLTSWTTPVEFGAAPGTDGLSVFYYSVFIASATTPATPGASGSYDFGTLTGTPPTGWSNFPPTPAPGEEIWVSSAQAAASTPNGIWTAGSGDWSTPVQYNGTAGTDALVMAVTYDQGSIFTRNNANVWTPTPVANIITSTANVVATRGSTVAGYVNQQITYNINTGAWTTTTGSTLNPGNFTIGSPQTTTSRYFNTVQYSDGSGSSATNIQYAIVEGGVNGNAGPAGSRGFIPLAYIQTPTNPITASTAQLTSWFSALRTNGVPPIGISPDSGNIYTPIPGDTANFNDPTTNLQITKTYDGTTWQNVVGEVINGNLVVVGSITSNKLSANDIYALNIQSTGATIGDNNSPGFWLQASTGNARFGGAVSIGNQLTVGSIINNSTLASNSVPEAAIQSGAVTNSKLGSNSVSDDKIQNTTITGGKIATGTITATNIQSGTITATQIAAGTITATNIAASTITGDRIAANTISATNIAASTITGDKIAANTISAGSIQANSITATQISSSYIYAGNIVSTGATLGDNNSGGYWLRYTDGSARFGGNVSIGNNLTVGNLISASALNANTVNAINIVPGVINPPASSTYFVSPNITLGGGSTNWNDNGSYYYYSLGYTYLPNNSGYQDPNTFNPTFRLSYQGNLTFTNSNPGATYPFVIFYFKSLVPNGGDPQQGGTNYGVIQQIGNQNNFYGLTSYSGTTGYSQTVSISKSAWSTTTNVVVGVAMLASRVAPFNAAAYNWSNIQWNVIYG